MQCTEVHNVKSSAVILHLYGMHSSTVVRSKALQCSAQCTCSLGHIALFGVYLDVEWNSLQWHVVACSPPCNLSSRSAAEWRLPKPALTTCWNNFYQCQLIYTIQHNIPQKTVLFDVQMVNKTNRSWGQPKECCLWNQINCPLYSSIIIVIYQQVSLILTDSNTLV